MIIDSYVLDLTNFVDAHPGGSHVLLAVAGKDCTAEFYGLHRHAILEKYGPKYTIGKLAGESPLIQSQIGAISKVPYAESSFWMGSKSAYYTESHVKFRAAVREFIDKEIRPHAASYEEDGGKLPIEIYQAMGRFGLLASRIGPGPHLKGFNLPGGVKPEG